MPFLITEPQKIDGTKLGYAVYPYHASFDDHIDTRDYNHKLMIFKMKDGPFMEAEKIVHEEHYRYQDVHHGYVDERLYEFLKYNQEYITDKSQVVAFFSRNTAKNK